MFMKYWTYYVPAILGTYAVVNKTYKAVMKEPT